MCGICGVHNLDLEPLRHSDAIGRMSARLRHRGPDSQGTYALPHLAFAIRRLSIIDLETGDQPLSNEDGSVTLVFNGEIYNYRELRAQLLDRGHWFKTQSDGEVIAHLYEEQGPDFVKELNGMFAIALWDGRANRLILARDRAGEKPLYYRRQDSTLLFGSEIKALLEYPGISRELDREAVAQYFFYGYFPSPRTVFTEIRKLPAGHRMVAQNGKVTLEAYWTLKDHLRTPGLPPPTRRDETALAEELRGRIREAALSRLVSDVPLGVFLSGGIDSSTVVAVMSELSPGNVSTFSMSFPEASFNESGYAELVARHFHTRHHVLRADGASLREALDVLADQLDEPVADPAVLPTYLLSRFARQHIKVALSGEGSDELFAGYPTHVGARLAQYYLRLPHIVRRHVFQRLCRFLPVTSAAVPKGLFLRRFLTYAERDPAERHQIWFSMFSPAELDQLFAPGWVGSSPPGEAVFDPMAALVEGVRFENTLAELLYLDFRMYLEDNLLVKVDRASMACSLEVRTPFLDHRLAEFAAGLPSSLRLRGFTMKYLLKKAVEEWLPREIVSRQKRGFSVPIASWMRNDLRNLLDRVLDEDQLKQQGIFNAAFVRRLLGEHLSGKADHRKALWTLLCFQLWHDRWAE
jgi:asparagine synthase (glutamine-hydrolysing)